MSSCRLSIHVERSDAWHRSGDVLSGELSVYANDDVRASRVFLELFWRTHGRGNVQRGPVVTYPVAGAVEWRRGQEYRYPFEIVLPGGPSTYHGRLLNVDWYLKARADVPWALDPSTEVELFVIGDRSDEVPPGAGPAGIRPIPGWAKIVGAVCALAFMGIGSVTALNGIGAGRTETALGGLVCLAVGLLAFAKSARNDLQNLVARWKIGAPEITIEPTVVNAGEPIAVRARLRLTDPTRVNAVTARLCAREVVVCGTSTRVTTEQHRVFEVSKPLLRVEKGESAHPMRLLGGANASPVELEAFLDVPEEAPPSLTLRDNALCWLVAVDVDVRGWPDWHREYPITVLSPAARGDGPTILAERA